MNDNLSIVITVIVMVAILVIFPLYNFFERQDDMAYNVALSSVTEFVDEVLKNGYLDQDTYTNFVNKLAATGDLFDIQLEAHRNVIVNTEEFSDTQNSKEYSQKYKIDYNNDIFKDLDSNDTVNTTTLSSTTIKNNVYKLNSGDGFYVKLKNKNKTMAAAIFNNIIPNSDKTRISINYGGIVKNNAWSSIKNSDLFDQINALDVSRIVGPYDANGNRIPSVIQGSTIYFRAYLFNSSIAPVLNNFGGNIDSITLENDYYNIKISNVHVTDQNQSSNAYISSIHAQTTNDSVNSSSFSIFDISKLVPTVTANPNVITGTSKIIILNNNIKFDAVINDDKVDIKSYVWVFKSHNGTINTYITTANKNEAVQNFIPNQTGAYTYEVYGMDQYGNKTGKAGGYFMCLPSTNSNGSYPMNSSMAGRMVSIESEEIDGARISDFKFDVNVSSGHNSGNRDIWRIEGYNTKNNSWESVKTTYYTYYDKDDNAKITKYDQIPYNNKVSKGVYVEGKIAPDSSYSKLRFSYQVASGHERCINSGSKITYDVTYDFSGN